MKVGNTIFDKRMEIIRMIRDSADLGGKDPDHIVELCHEVRLSLFLSSTINYVVTCYDTCWLNFRILIRGESTNQSVLLIRW